MSNKTFKYLVAREQDGTDTELAGRSGSDKLDLTLTSIDFRGPLDQHGQLRVMSADLTPLEKFSVSQAGAVSIADTLGVTGLSTLAEAEVSDLTQHRLVLAGASGRLRDESGLTYQATSGLAITGTLDASGDFAISDKFSVAAADGSTLTEGPLRAKGTADFDGAIRVAMDHVGNDGCYWMVTANGETVQFNDLSVRSTYGDANSDVFKITATDGSFIAAGGELSVGADGAIDLGSVFSVDASGAILAQSIGDMDTGASQWKIVAAGDATLKSVQATGGLFSMDAAGTITGQKLKAGNEKFQVAADGSKVSLSDGTDDVFEVSDAGALKAHSIEDIDGNAKWSIDTSGDALVQQLNAKDAAHLESTLLVDGILSQKDELQLESSKKLRFWDSNSVGQENKGFVGYDSVNDAIVIDAAPDGAGGKVVIEGDLQVTGSTTTVNSTEVEIADKLFRVAKDSSDLTAADGSGLEVGDNLASFKYDHDGGSDSHWDLSHGLTVAAKINSADVEAVGEVKGATLDITATAVLASAKVSDLVDGRVVLAGLAGELEDSGNLTFDGSALTVTGSASVSADIDASGGKFSTDASNSLVKIKDYGLNIIDSRTGSDVVKASITDAGALSIESDFTVATDKFKVDTVNDVASLKDLAFRVLDSADAVKASITDAGVATFDGDINSTNGRLVVGADNAIIDNAGSIYMKGDLAVGDPTSALGFEAKADGSVNLLGTIMAYGAGWSITQAGDADLNSIEIDTDKFKVDASGAMLNVASISSDGDVAVNGIALSHADSSIAASGSLAADGEFSLYKYTDSSTSQEMYAIRGYNAGGTSVMPEVQINSYATFGSSGFLSHGGATFQGDIWHNGSTANFLNSKISMSSPAPGMSGTEAMSSQIDILPAAPMSGGTGGGGSTPVMPNLGSAAAEWENVYAKNLHAEAMNLDSLLLTGEAPAQTQAGQLWYDDSDGKLYFHDDEGVSVLGENDLKALAERDVSINDSRHSDGSDDGKEASLSIYTHRADGTAQAGVVKLTSKELPAGQDQNGNPVYGQELMVQAGIITHDQSASMLSSSGRKVTLPVACVFKDAISSDDFLMIDAASGGLKKMDAAVKDMPFGIAMQDKALDEAYEGHIEMKDREYGWVNLPANASVPAFGDELYFGANSNAGKAVTLAEADAAGDGAMVIKCGEVLQGVDMGNGVIKAYVQFSYRYKWKI